MAIDIKKALDTAGGDAIIPERLDPELSELADEKSVLRAVLRRMPWSTNSYEWNQRTALGAAAAYNEAAGFSANNSTLARKSVTIKMIKSEGAVSNLLQLASQDYINALEMEIEGATKSLAYKIEDLYINGSVASDPNEFDGMDIQMTSTYDAAGVKISLDILDDAIAAARNDNGSPDLILLSERDKGELDKAVRKDIQLNWTRVPTAFGVDLQTYQDIPVISSPFVKSDKDYGTTATGDYSVAYIIDTSEVIVPELLGISFEEVAVETDSTAFRLKSYLALAVKAPKFCRKVINIAKP